MDDTELHKFVDLILDIQHLAEEAHDTMWGIFGFSNFDHVKKERIEKAQKIMEQIRGRVENDLVHTLMINLKNDEVGKNEHGPIWKSSDLVKTLRWFYTEYERLYGGNNDSRTNGAPSTGS